MPFKFSDLVMLRLGGTKDSAALSSIGAGALLSNPLLGLPPVAGVLGGAALASWGGVKLANRVAEALSMGVFDLKDEDGLKMNSSALPPHDPNGVHMGYLADTGEGLVIPQEAWTRHLSVIGMTGVGKTVLANWLMFQQVMRGGGLMFIDGKVDADNVTFMRAMCAVAGREDDLLILSPGDPDNSNTYNPFLFGDPDEIGARVLALIPTSENNAGTDHYRSSAASAMTNFIGGLKATGHAYNALDIATALQSDEVMAAIRKKMTKNQRLTDLFDQWYQQFTVKGKDGSSTDSVDMRKVKELLGGVTGKIFQFGSGDFGKICNTYTPDIILEDVILQNKILYVGLPALGKKESAGAFGRMLIGDLRTATARIQKLPKEKRPNPSFFAFLDEAGSYLTDAAETLVEQARSASVTLCPAVQSKANYDSVSKNFTGKMSGNSLVRCFFKTNESETMKWIEEMGGEEKVSEYTINFSETQSQSSASISSGKIRGDTSASGFSFSERQVDVKRIPASSVGALGQGECIVQYDGSKIYHIKIPFLSFDNDFLKSLGPVQINRPRAKKGLPGLNAYQIAVDILANRKGKSKKSAGKHTESASTSEDQPSS